MHQFRDEIFSISVEKFEENIKDGIINRFIHSYIVEKLH